MTDDLDTLKAALKATPAPDPDAKAAALRLAMENFDRLQGSTDPARLPQDRPVEAGFLNGVRRMLKTLNTRPYLTATTSVAALMIGLFMAVPQVQQALHPLEKPKLTAGELAPPTPPVATTPTDKDAETDLGRLETTATAEVPSLPAAPPSDQPAVAARTAPLAEPAPVVPEQMADATVAPKPAAKMKLDALSGGQAVGIIAPRALALDPGTAANAIMAAPTIADQIVPPEPNTEAFANAAANPVHVTAEEPVSTFSVDVDTASYAVIRSSP